MWIMRINIDAIKINILPKFYDVFNDVELIEILLDI